MFVFFLVALVARVYGERQLMFSMAVNYTAAQTEPILLSLRSSGNSNFFCFVCLFVVCLFFFCFFDFLIFLDFYTRCAGYRGEVWIGVLGKQLIDPNFVELSELYRAEFFDVDKFVARDPVR